MLGIPCPDKLNLRLTSSSRTVITPSDTPMFTYTCSLIICNTSLVKFHVLVTCCPLYNSKLTDEQFTQSLYMYNYTSVRFQRSYSIHQLMHYTITCEDDFWEKCTCKWPVGDRIFPRICAVGSLSTLLIFIEILNFPYGTCMKYIYTVYQKVNKAHFVKTRARLNYPIWINTDCNIDMICRVDNANICIVYIFWCGCSSEQCHQDPHWLKRLSSAYSEEIAHLNYPICIYTACNIDMICSVETLYIYILYIFWKFINYYLDPDEIVYLSNLIWTYTGWNIDIRLCSVEMVNICIL